MTAYPGAACASILRRSTVHTRSYVPKGSSANPDRARAEAERRARTAIIRFCVQNQCDRLFTFTYAPDHLPSTRAEVWEHVAQVRRFLRDRFPDLVCVATIEGTVDPTDGCARVHVHVASNRFVPKPLLEAAWRWRGHVDPRRLHVRTDGFDFGNGKRARARRAGAYIGKYVSKSFGESDRSFNGRRYSCTKGATLRVVRARFLTHSEALAWASSLVGGPIVGFWSSSDAPDWCGPPCWSYDFGDP